MTGIVRNKITVDDLAKCFKQLNEFNKGDKEVIMYHPVAREYKAITVALEYDNVSDVYGDPFILFKRYTTVTGAKVWKLESDIDIVSKY